MASTYTTNLGIEKIATGEQSGTWGSTTNTNLDLIDQAVNGIVQITVAATGSTGSPNALTITNGSASDGRNKFIDFYSPTDLGGTVYYQLDPNDAEKIAFVRNSLGGGQTLVLFQGTYNASNDVEVPNGVDMLVKFDGTGASATVTNVFEKLQVNALSVNDGNITNVGDIALDSISADGTQIDIDITDNTASAFTISEGANNYIEITTTDGSELITVSKNSTFAGTTIADLGVVTTVDINGGTIDGVTIGGASAGAGTFTTITGSGDVNVYGGNSGSNANRVALCMEGSGAGRILVNGSGVASNGSFKIDLADSAGTVAYTLTYDSSGNLGLGNTPSATSASGYTAFELGANAGTGLTGNNGDLYINENAYVGGGAWRYAASSIASAQYNLGSGVHRWYTAAAGTAGNAITWTQAMTLDASGRLGIGTTTPTNTSGLEIQTVSTTAGLWVQTGGTTSSYTIADFRTGTNLSALSVFGNGNSIFEGNVGIGTTSPDASMGPGLHIKSASGNSLILEKDTGAAIQFRSDASTIRATIGGINGADGLTIATGAAQTERMRITSAGSVNIGGTSGAAKFEVNNAVSTTGSLTDSTINLATTAVTGRKVNIGFGLAGGVGNTNAATIGFDVINGAGALQGDLFFATRGSTADSVPTERARIDSSGNLLVGTTSANGSTSNTKPVVAGAFRSLNGTLASLASGTAYTMFTASADFATWMVNVHCIVSNAIYSETAIVQINNSSVRVDIISAGSGVAISNSGLDIKVTQTSGITQAELLWSAVRMA
jgi:hypothetical protein